MLGMRKDLVALNRERWFREGFFCLCPSGGECPRCGEARVMYLKRTGDEVECAFCGRRYRPNVSFEPWEAWDRTVAKVEEEEKEKEERSREVYLVRNEIPWLRPRVTIVRRGKSKLYRPTEASVKRLTQVISILEATGYGKITVFPDGWAAII